MRRAALERLRLLKRQRDQRTLARARGVPAEPLAINHFRKQRRIGGCGNSRCWLCHGDKLAQRPTPQARRAANAWADGLRSLDTQA